MQAFRLHTASFQRGTVLDTGHWTEGQFRLLQSSGFLPPSSQLPGGIDGIDCSKGRTVTPAGTELPAEASRLADLKGGRVCFKRLRCPDELARRHKYQPAVINTTDNCSSGTDSSASSLLGGDSNDPSPGGLSLISTPASDFLYTAGMFAAATITMGMGVRKRNTKRY